MNKEDERTEEAEAHLNQSDKEDDTDATVAAR
jgi:hypothetical protein